jgi:hypothetical protein
VKEKPSQALSDPTPLRFPCSACGKNLRVAPKLAGKKVKCPRCGKPTPAPLPEPAEPEPIVIAPEPEPLEIVPEPEPEPEPMEEAQELDPEPTGPAPYRIRIMPIVAVFIVMFAVIGCSVYANLSFAVTNRVNYKYFPPFKPYVNSNTNRHLGAEYFNIAQAMVAGEGFSSPFKEKTGPTAWMPPILPAILAGLLWACDNEIDAVMTVCLFLQGMVLIGTGFLVLALAWQTTGRLGILLAAAAFVVYLVSDFRMWFQTTHDTSLVLLALDVVVAGFAWCRPLQGWKSGILWGLAGGTCAMVSPIVALTWGVLTAVLMIRERAWFPFGIAVLCAAVTLAPWTIRNYLIFGRIIPVKSNAAYELWQSQCRQKDGLLRDFNGHPYGSPGPERQLYKEIGEIAFIEQKRELFNKAVRDDPLEFADRVACRFLGATLWYVPFNRSEVTQRPAVTWTSRALHPLPFLALLLLAMSAAWRRLHWIQWAVMGAYVLYLGPYIAVSYYERYAMPSLAVKVLLVIWAADCLLCLVWPPPAKEPVADKPGVA